MRYYDTHTHLNSDALYPHWKTHLQKFADMGGKGVVNIGVDEEYNEKAIEIAREAKSMGIDCWVKATLGYHPSEVCFNNITQDNIEDKMNILRAKMKEQRAEIIAVGECGIDAHYEGDPKIDLQKKLFRMQCELAQELGLPIVIHSRDDFESTFDVIKDFKDEKIYFHCFGYGPEEVMKLQEYFPHIRFGFCGNVSYPKAQPLRDALLSCSIQNIVLETDAPWLSPQAVRGETNEPVHVKYIYEYVASLLNMSGEELCNQIETNVHNLYNINIK